MSIYLIDYENVNEAGLEGVKALRSDDQVHIFFSDQIKSIPFERSIELTQSKATIEFIRTHKTAKNYLDFQLSTYLGYLIGKGEKGEVYVVSNDKGFDSVVDFWKGRNIKISRYENIANKPSPKKNASKQASDNKKQDTKQAGDNKKQDTKQAADNKKQDTKQAADNKKQDAKPAPENKKQGKRANKNQGAKNAVEKQDNATEAGNHDWVAETSNETNTPDARALAEANTPDAGELTEANNPDARELTEANNPDAGELTEANNPDTKALAEANDQDEDVAAEAQNQDIESEGNSKPAVETKKRGNRSTTEKKRKDTKTSADKKISDLTETWRKKVRAAVKEDKLSPGSYSAVYKAIASSKDKLDLNNRLVKAFDSTRGGMIYKHVKDIFDEYSKS